MLLILSLFTVLFSNLGRVGNILLSVISNANTYARLVLCTKKNIDSSYTFNTINVKIQTEKNVIDISMDRKYM